MACRIAQPGPLLLQVLPKFKFIAFFCAAASLLTADSRVRWNEINMGPFYVDSDGDIGNARNVLNQLEQVRWVLGNLLEDNNLTTIWPVRVVIDSKPQGNERIGFVSQNEASLRGQHTLVLKPGEEAPLGMVAGLFLDANTPPLPAEVESGLRQLFGTLEARGSRVKWGGIPEHADLDYARMQLFATKFEYGASFHIFLTSLKNGGTIRAAASNAFGRPFDELEKEAADRLRAGNWEAVSVSGRPLDPKRDFGEHSVPGALVDVSVADAQLGSNRKAAEAAYKAAIEAGPPATAEGFAGLAQLAKLEGSDPAQFIDSAIRANSRSALVYLEASMGREPDDAIQLAKRAAALNPRWADPLMRQSELAENLNDREVLLKKAALLDRRRPQIWIDLAHTQVENGNAAVAQGSWLKAEDAASSEAERGKIHQLRMTAEAARLDAAERARQSSIDAAYQADQRAQQAQAAKVRAAERKANTTLDAESKTGKPDAPLAWSDLAPKKKAEGMLVKVDCVGSNARLGFRDRTGATLSLLWRNMSDLGLGCGEQNPPVRVSLTYSAQPDERFQTDGTVSSLRVWPNRQKSK